MTAAFEASLFLGPNPETPTDESNAVTVPDTTLPDGWVVAALGFAHVLTDDSLGTVTAHTIGVWAPQSAVMPPDEPDYVVVVDLGASPATVTLAA